MPVDISILEIMAASVIFLFDYAPLGMESAITRYFLCKRAVTNVFKHSLVISTSTAIFIH
jgi:hypothetical protein